VNAPHATPIQARRDISGDVSSSSAAVMPGLLATVAAGDVTLPARSAGGTDGAAGRGGVATRVCAAGAGLAADAGADAAAGRAGAPAPATSADAGISVSGTPGFCSSAIHPSTGLTQPAAGFTDRRPTPVASA
jgi:hypothetical protein